MRSLVQYYARVAGGGHAARLADGWKEPIGVYTPPHACLPWCLPGGALGACFRCVTSTASTLDMKDPSRWNQENLELRVCCDWYVLNAVLLSSTLSK